MADKIIKDTVKTSESKTPSRSLPLPDAENQMVRRMADNLKLEFEAERGEGVEAFISGDIEKSSKAHRDLFRKAVKEPDSKSRRLSHLAHLQLEIDHNDAQKVKSSYGEQKGKGGVPLAQIFPGIFRYDGMVPVGTELAKGHQEQRLNINKDKLAEEYVNFGEAFLGYFKAFEGREHDGLTQEQLAVYAAAQDIVLRYFGLSDANAEELNKQMYEAKSSRNLEEFNGKNNAACTEIGALAQELVSFAGERSTLISGGPLEIADSEGKYSTPPLGGHVFLVSFLGENEDKPFLFDPTNPIIMQNSSQPNNPQIKPYLAPLTQDQLRSLGAGTEVEFGGEKRLYGLS